MEEKKEVYCECCDEEEEEEELTKKGLIILIVRLSLSLALSLIGLFWFNEENLQGYGLGETPSLLINLSIFLAAFLIVGYEIIWKTLKNFRHFRDIFDENTLMLIASIGAFSLRFFGQSHNEFFEAVMIVFLYTLGELFEDLAVDRSKKAIRDAIGLRPRIANLFVDGEEKEIDPEDLKVGDIIIVKVGEIIPSDGTIIEGSGGVDASSLTGESLPIFKNEGDKVNSGTILRSGSIKVEIEKEYKDSTVSKIIELAESNEKSKSKATRFVSAFSKIYTPIVCGIALLIAIIPPLFIGIGDGGVWADWLYKAICCLVISCPCAIVVSIPLAYFSGIGLASKNGILVKGASYFDWLNSLSLLVSDKTGTLTYGHFEIDHMLPNEEDEELFKEYLLASESRSNHPIAKAIIGNNEISSLQEFITEYDEIPGRGVRMVYKGHKVLSGGKPLMIENEIVFEPCHKTGSTTYLAVDGIYWGHATLCDLIKEETPNMVQNLSKMGIGMVILTGDRKETSLEVAERVGAKEVFYELLPEEKTSLLKERIESSKGGVAYLGDGINDAPSLALADVGIAMGGAGSDVAVEEADIVIMDDDLSKVAKAIKIAKITKNRAIFNIVLALSVKLTIMVLSLILGNKMPMWAAILADTGTMLICVLSSLLILGKRVK